MYITLITMEHDDGYGNESTATIQRGSLLLWEEVLLQGFTNHRTDKTEPFAGVSVSGSVSGRCEVFLMRMALKSRWACMRLCHVIVLKPLDPCVLSNTFQ